MAQQQVEQAADKPAEAASASVVAPAATASAPAAALSGPALSSQPSAASGPSQTATQGMLTFSQQLLHPPGSLNGLFACISCLNDMTQNQAPATALSLIRSLPLQTPKRPLQLVCVCSYLLLPCMSDRPS